MVQTPRGDAGVSAARNAAPHIATGTIQKERRTQNTQTGASRRTLIDAEGCIEHPPFITPGLF